MAAANENTFKLVPPRRPTDDDVDATVQNEGADQGPIATGYPYANQLNQWGKLTKVYGGELWVAMLEVHFSGGTPSIYAVQALNDSLVADNFTVTDNTGGDTTITWPADTFPTAASSPEAKVVDESHGSWLQPTCSSPSNGVRVKTRNSGGTLTDVNFKVYIF